MKKLFAVLILIHLTYTASAKTESNVPVDEIRNFIDIYNVIRNDYVEEKDGKTLLDYAIEGMLSGLDPHSAYFKQSELDNFNDSTQGTFFGFGVQLDMQNGKLIIIAPIPGSPADEAGLKARDQIIKIDDQVIENLSLPEVMTLLKETDTVTFTVQRREEKPKTYTVTKSTVEIPSVNSKLLEAGYGYLQITQFQQKTDQMFARQLQSLLDEDINGLIVDLRNNPGGLVHVATNIADQFLDAGLIVSTKNENTGVEDKIHATKNVMAEDMPLVILINEGSASASELLAGALQSHKRAIVVGQPSFGKGSVQNVITLSNGDAIKLTTGRYYTPNGESIQAKGITPDIQLSQLTVSEAEIDLLSYSEADIKGHLPPQQRDDANSNLSQEASEKTLAKNDLQLFEALNILKVLVLTQ